MGLGSFARIPVEIVVQICEHCDLEDVLALQESHATLGLTIRNNYFTKFQTARVHWMEQASIVCLGGKETRDKEITTNSQMWRDVIRQASRIKTLELKKTDAAYRKEILVAMAGAWKLNDLTLVLKPSPRPIRPEYTCKNYNRLTRFVEAQKGTLSRLVLESSAESRIELSRAGNGAHIRYSHQRNIPLHHQLINPLFRAMLTGGPALLELDMTVAGCEQLEYSLQSAFQAALPYDQRNALRSLRIHFGPEVSTLSHREVDRVLTTYAPTLHVTPNLTHIVCDLSHCSVEPSSLEGIFMAISSELRGSHRISLVTAGPTLEKMPDETSRRAVTDIWKSLRMWFFRQIDQQVERRDSTIEKRPLAPPQRTVVNGPVDADAGTVLVGIGRAVIARLLFIVHSVATVWATVTVQGSESVWVFAFIVLLIIFEGAYTIVMRAGDERRWFCTSVFLYVLATAPPIWLLEMKMCEWRRERFEGVQQTSLYLDDDNELRLQLLEQLMLVVLIIGRWLLPKGNISREQLSQILLAYLAISSDIVEFFDVFKERAVFTSQWVQVLVLIPWTLSLLQFPFVLTVSRARKMRVAITSPLDEIAIPERPDVSNICNDVDIWAIVLANCLQDIPFLLVRLYLMFGRGLITYTMLFFTCKNALIIVLQTYRAFVLINDRYIKPAKGEKKKRQHRHKSAPKRKKQRREFHRSEEMEHLCPPPELEFVERSPKRENRRRREPESAPRSPRARKVEPPEERRVSRRRSNSKRATKKSNENERRTRSASRTSPPQNKDERRTGKSINRRSSTGSRGNRIR
ncbi:unnamed protein product, partial [Mesorhabditis spiculigera]